MRDYTKYNLLHNSNINKIYDNSTKQVDRVIGILFNL